MAQTEPNFTKELEDMAAVFVLCLNTLVLAAILIAFSFFACLAITGDVKIKFPRSSKTSQSAPTATIEKLSPEVAKKPVTHHRYGIIMAGICCLFVPVFLAINVLITPFAKKGAFRAMSAESFGISYVYLLRGWAEVLLFALILVIIWKLFRVGWSACRRAKRSDPDPEIGEAQGEDPQS